MTHVFSCKFLLFAHIFLRVIHLSVCAVGIDAFDQPSGMKYVASTSSLLVAGYTNIYISVWKILLQLYNDPFGGVGELARKVVGEIKRKVSSNIALWCL